MKNVFRHRRQLIGRWMAVGFGGLLCSVALAQETQPVALTVGVDAPDMTMTGIDGKEFKLSDVTGAGKNVALMFSRAHW